MLEPENRESRSLSRKGLKDLEGVLGLGGAIAVPGGTKWVVAAVMGAREQGGTWKAQMRKQKALIPALTQGCVMSNSRLNVSEPSTLYLTH